MDKTFTDRSKIEYKIIIYASGNGKIMLESSTGSIFIDSFDNQQQMKSLILRLDGTIKIKIYDMEYDI